MHSGSRAICLLMALLAAVTELVSAAFSPEAHDAAKPAALAGTAVNEAAASQAAAVVIESAAPSKKAAPAMASSQNFSTSPLEMRIVAYAPHLRVIANSEADGRRMASLADAHERQLLFVAITLG